MLFSPIEVVTFYFFCSGFHHQEHVAGLCTFILFYLMKYVYKFQECSSSQFQCRPFKSWRFWTKQADQGSEYSWCLQNDRRDWKLWVSLITSVYWNMIYNTENLIIFSLLMGVEMKQKTGIWLLKFSSTGDMIRRLMSSLSQWYFMR